MAGPGAYIFGCAGPVLFAEEAAFFAESQPWGFILFARNVETPDQLRRLTSDLRDSVGWQAPILIDQEGGRVTRMPPEMARPWPAARDFAAAAGQGAERAMWLRSRITAHELVGFGIDVNCTPLGDVARDETHPFLLNRCYGDDPATVIRLARATADGQISGGVLPVIKHMPGHGRATVNSHDDLPRTDASRATLLADDFAPFRALADLPMGMTAHVLFQAIDPELPGTVSPKIVRTIRDEIGFDGLLMTDDISMEALGGSVAERGMAALSAGCDMILHCNGEMADMVAIASAAPRLSDAGQTRAGAALDRRQVPDPIDIAAAEAELEALLQKAAHV